MSIFRWAAPLFKCAARRWTSDDIEHLAAHLRPFVPPKGVFLDLGGGTGDLGAGIARALHARVVVVDPVRQMLVRVSPDPLVSVWLARAEALPFPNHSFDAALCSDAFHHFPDQESAARELARVVRPGGGMLILEMEPAGWTRPVATLERLLGEPAAFKSSVEMEEFMARFGIAGTSTRLTRISYSFLGSVEEPR